LAACLPAPDWGEAWNHLPVGGVESRNATERSGERQVFRTEAGIAGVAPSPTAKKPDANAVLVNSERIGQGFGKMPAGSCNRHLSHPTTRATVDGSGPTGRTFQAIARPKAGLRLRHTSGKRGLWRLAHVTGHFFKHKQIGQILRDTNEQNY